MSASTLSNRPVRAIAIRVQPGAAPWGIAAFALQFLGIGAARLLRLDTLPWPVCFFKAVTGWPCFTCGGTRALSHLARLDLAGALALNPLVAIAGIAVPLWAILELVSLARGGALRLTLSPRSASALRGLVVLLLVVNWVYLVAVGR